MTESGSMKQLELRFALPGGAHALFTTRANGNLSSVGGEGAEQGLQARELVREQLGLRRLLRGYQVHGTTIERHLGREERPPAATGGAAATKPTRTGDLTIPADTGAQPEIEADGQATTLRGVGATVLTADCLPVVLAADAAVAVVHAGWRGLAAGVLEEGVRAVGELGGAYGMVAIIGPGAGKCCYEVGEEVHRAFGGAQRQAAKIDLKAIARDRLRAAGVSEVHDVQACTICDERFFSYRREGARAGRQGCVAWLS
jgi:polyphenol oxidase